MKNLKVKNLTIKKRLDLYITEACNISRSKAIELIKKDLVLINDKAPKSQGLLVFNGDVITIKDDSNIENISIDLTPSNKPLNIIYEDDQLMVINKPKNVLVHPTSFNESDTIAARVLFHLKNNFTNNSRPGIVHRLDKNTTGLLVVTKNLQALTNLQKQLADRTLERKYLALCHNNFDNKKLLIKVPIIRSNSTSKMMASDSVDAKMAITEVTLVKNLLHKMSLVECTLQTGRTHQIRVHLKYAGHPIYNDDMYGEIEDIRNKDYCQFLHAYKISFIHPTLNKVMEFKVDPDKIFLNKVKEFE